MAHDHMEKLYADSHVLCPPTTHEPELNCEFCERPTVNRETFGTAVIPLCGTPACVKLARAAYGNLTPFK